MNIQLLDKLYHYGTPWGKNFELEFSYRKMHLRMFCLILEWIRSGIRPCVEKLNDLFGPTRRSQTKSQKLLHQPFICGFTTICCYAALCMVIIPIFTFLSMIEKQCKLLQSFSQSNLYLIIRSRFIHQIRSCCELCCLRTCNNTVQCSTYRLSLSLSVECSGLPKASPLGTIA